MEALRLECNAEERGRKQKESLTHKEGRKEGGSCLEEAKDDNSKNLW